MSQFKRLLSINMTLGVLSVLALIVQYMALADIAKSGIDATLEWRVVGWSMILMALFVVVTMVTLVRLIRLSDRRAGMAGESKAG